METVHFDGGAPVGLTLNRTIVGWKHGELLVELNRRLLALNRTIVGWKPSPARCLTSPSSALNRTIVGWKPLK